MGTEKEEEKVEINKKEEIKETEDDDEELPEPEYFNNLDRDKLVELIEEKVKIEDFNKVKKEVGLIKAAFRNQTIHYKQEKLNEFLNTGGDEADYDAPTDELEERFNIAFEKYE